MGSIMRFVKDDSGADLVEYALLVGIVALGAVTAIGGVRTSIINMFTSITTSLNTALAGSTGTAQ